MDQLQFQVRTGLKSVKILDDFGEVRGIFKFNPEDIKSARKANDLVSEFKEKSKVFQERSAEIEGAAGQIALLDEIVDYFKSGIDSVWGDGSSKILFGDANTLDMFDDFFDGITPFYEMAAKQRTSKYIKE